MVRERLLIIRQLDQMAGIACGDRSTYLRYLLGPEFIAGAHLAGQGPPVSVAPAEGLLDGTVASDLRQVGAGALVARVAAGEPMSTTGPLC